jgi:hypothetical protein
MKLRYSLAKIDLGKVTPDDADLSHLPPWLRDDVRELLRRMDYANKSTGQTISPTEIVVPVEIDPSDLWKHTDLGEYEVVQED